MRYNGQDSFDTLHMNNYFTLTETIFSKSKSRNWEIAWNVNHLLTVGHRSQCGCDIWEDEAGVCEDGTGVIDTEVSSRVSLQRKWRAKVGNEEEWEEEVQRESGKKSSPELKGEKVLRSYHWTHHRPRRMRKTIHGKYCLEFTPGLFSQVFKMSALGRACWRGNQVKSHEMKASRETQRLPEVKRLLKFTTQH